MHEIVFSAAAAAADPSFPAENVEFGGLGTLADKEARVCSTTTASGVPGPEPDPEPDISSGENEQLIFEANI